MWFILSVGTAFFTATASAIMKLLIKDNDETVIGWLRYLVCLPVLVILLIASPKPHLGSSFWMCTAILLPMELGAFFLYLRSIKISPFSLSFPFLGFTPVFAIATSYLILGERLTRTGIFGILLVTAGAYILNGDLIKQGILEPIKNIHREKGSFLMLMVAFIYSITSVLGKKAVTLSNPHFFPLLYYPLVTVIYTAIIFPWRRPNLKKINFGKREWGLLILTSLVFITGLMLHFRAISMIEAAYMISVKRLSLLFSIIYGAILFKEKQIGYRMAGGLVMVLGTLLLAI